MNYIGLPIIIIGLLVLLFASFFIVKQQTIAIVERFGKFTRDYGAGINMKIPVVDRVAGRVSLRIQQLDVIVETKISLHSPQLGSKKIYEYKEKDYSMILSQLISGYIMSPYEDRILVILKNERWGWEGVPSVVYFSLTGSNLTTGFQPDTN